MPDVVNAGVLAVFAAFVGLLLVAAAHEGEVPIRADLTGQPASGDAGTQASDPIWPGERPDAQTFPAWWELNPFLRDRDAGDEGRDDDDHQSGGEKDDDRDDEGDDEGDDEDDDDDHADDKDGKGDDPDDDERDDDD